MAVYLLDTHVLVRWFTSSKKLSRDQSRILHEGIRRRESLAISAMTLLEIGILCGHGSNRLTVSVSSLLDDIRLNPAFEILPITFDIAAEVASLGPSLHDPADRAIVATARVHRLRLLTSDQRIIESNLVPVIC